MFNRLPRIPNVFLMRAFVVFALASTGIAGDKEEGQLQVYRLKETNFNTSVEDWVVKSTYGSIEKMVSGSPLDLFILGVIPTVRWVAWEAPKLTASSGNVIYDAWGSRPKLVATGMGIGAIGGAVAGWFAGKGVNRLIDRTIEHAVETAAKHVVETVVAETSNTAMGVFLRELLQPFLL